MISTFKRYAATISNTEQTIYTVPANTTAVIIGAVMSNITTGNIQLTVKCAGYYLIKDVYIPNNSSLSILDGKVVLIAGDTVKAQTDTVGAGDFILSLMENT
jgi:hypothetical protein